ncbi:hypothetical protein [Allonocardiopsis opalescens]|uniref:Uncharacterized protein n=1 Tax=Allonocardiopsis opalescens TaxID=1144618 RepID=A0A2T0Q3B2_9ACTN|nr:hypothetical protein [Allonocardiopsis opalescens]PRX98158.1 hypothetical protein CLV72_105511 [Allonocardiopsis opalescens]
MTRVYYDTEFIEDGRTVELISIGMVREDGAEYYAVARDAPWERVREDAWLMAHVVPSLPRAEGGGSGREPGEWPGIDLGDPCVKPKSLIAEEVAGFVLGVERPELWAWYGPYDYVVTARLFGSFQDRPPGWPMFAFDLKQEAVRLGDPRLPEQETGLHNALADARHNKVVGEFLLRRAEEDGRV